MIKEFGLYYATTNGINKSDIPLAPGTRGCRPRLNVSSWYISVFMAFSPPGIRVM